MKKITIIIAAIIMMAGFTTKTMAQTPTDTKTINSAAGARIVATLGITDGNATSGVASGLHFGTMARPTADATVTIAANAAGDRTGTAGVVLLGNSPLKHSAKYNVTGDADSYYTITLPPTPITISIGTGTLNIMSVGSWTCSQGTLNAVHNITGTSTFYVGATLSLNSGQNAGTYVGSFDVVVTYN